MIAASLTQLDDYILGWQRACFSLWSLAVPGC